MVRPHKRTGTPAGRHQRDVATEPSPRKVTLGRARTITRARTPPCPAMRRQAFVLARSAAESTEHRGHRLVKVLIPAHNEEKTLGATIRSLRGQSHPPDEIVIMCDRCTDRTVAIAVECGVTVLKSVANTGRKAGAMNQALDMLLPTLSDTDLVMCMDADTEVHPQLIENAVRHFDETPRLGAVSSNHLIRHHKTSIELLQAMEYERDRRFIGRRKGRYGCMTGMAAVYSVAALRDVAATHGSVYDPTNWTEDWKLTLALKHLRWDMVRPQDCLATTVPVSTAKGLFIQRERWARGYIQTLCQFGLTRFTAVPWLKQFGLVWSFMSRALVIYLLYASRRDLVATWTLAILAILIADSVNTVRKARVGPKAILFAIAFPIEIAYAWLITAAIVSGYYKELAGDGKHDVWKRVRR
jgi:poly-beta-1,6-N-acetyl-D-glucosamine synthase